MKKILVVFTGGTFSMKIDKKTGSAVPRYSGNELLDKIPGAKTKTPIKGRFCFLLDYLIIPQVKLFSSQ